MALNTMSMSGRSLEGRVAIVTGAARGLGAAQAEALAADGAHVLATDVRDELGAELAARLGDDVAYLRLDVTAQGDWRAAVAHAEATWGPVGILVNNAGIVDFGPLEDTTLEAFRAVLDVNLVGPFLGMRTVVPSMRRAGGGAIVNVSSNAGLFGVAGMSAYVSSKWGVRGLTKTAALELAADGIRVNSVHPGFTLTPLTDVEDPSDFIAGQPIRRPGRPEEIARLVRFLVSDESSYSTGAEFLADGGSTAGMAGRGSAADED